VNERQRFLETLTFGHPDKVPLEPGWPRLSTLAAWRKQGLPGQADWYACLMENLGIPYQPPPPRPELEVDFRLLPQFEEKVLDHRNGHLVVQDWMGAVTEISDEYDYTYIRTAKDFVTRKWHRFPVQSRQDWEREICPRYDPATPGRFPPSFSQRALTWAEREYPLKLSFNGPFWQMREWCGFEGLCMFMAEDPSFVEEMTSFWLRFVLAMLHRILPAVQPDFVMINEDMAYKEHSMISPRMARRFLLPAWAEWNRLLKEHGVPLIFMDSDGFVGELLPLWIEAGFQGSYPTEVAAGNDIVAYRRSYGRKMAFIGGIDKRALAAGGETMRAEVLRVVPPLLAEGGFIPGCDHGVPPDISWPAFVEYSRLLARLTGWL
jgi:uroporphyrinogen decarboxylase